MGMTDIFNNTEIRQLQELCETSNVGLIINNGRVTGAVKERKGLDNAREQNNCIV